MERTRPRLLLSGTPGRMTHYALAVERAGGAAFPAYAPRSGAGYDALVLCGGGDITPELFGQQDLGVSQDADPVREKSDLLLIPRFLAARRPVLGICRGAQILNVALGGTMIQDLGDRRETHAGTPAGDARHLVCAEPHSVLYDLYGPSFFVNSCHHQAADRPGEGLWITCRAPDGTVEALEHRTLPAWGVQWHPERLGAAGERLFAWFLARCGD